MAEIKVSYRNKDYVIMLDIKIYLLKYRNKFRPCIKIKGKRKLLYRYLLDCPNNLNVDHINGDTLDNRRKNLRICTPHENSMNRVKYSNNRSGYKGVRLKRNKYWEANISVNGKVKFIGSFKTAKDAAVAYNQAANKYFKEFANLNKID